MNAKDATISVVMAAGRGSRMAEFEGNKTLLPLVPTRSPYEGRHPILLHILANLPPGPKAIVVNYRMEDVKAATQDFSPSYCLQPELNGTGGALLAARTFIEQKICDNVVITMGDVPLVRRETYVKLIELLAEKRMVVLGFCPEDKREYGVVEIENGQVHRIIESKYWKKFSAERQSKLTVCNSGIYAVRKDDLVTYLAELASKPHRIHKQIQGKSVEIEEFFITDLVEYMSSDGLPVGCIIAEDAGEVMGVDDLHALKKAQEIFHSRSGHPDRTAG